MPAKIKISRQLFIDTIALLESLDLDVGDYDSETIQLYCYVLYTFKRKTAPVADDVPF